MVKYKYRSHELPTLDSLRFVLAEPVGHGKMYC